MTSLKRSGSSISHGASTKWARRAVISDLEYAVIRSTAKVPNGPGEVFGCKIPSLGSQVDLVLFRYYVWQQTVSDKAILMS
ncbi:hypothetical protein SCLCIDRAFT_408790 [Scleroderma citrinum Foug A]|uniref:Uncharacterized protein n=1 Tax=Scleroderma citrinum Foug A TaxID=1036808 RepID=A0A0C3DBR2_9AGAM|nr:hypothetical protein SCLCIDRAFT_408790 [Scleroderma citrinum Foug A]